MSYAITIDRFSTDAADFVFRLGRALSERHADRRSEEQAQLRGTIAGGLRAHGQEADVATRCAEGATNHVPALYDRQIESAVVAAAALLPGCGTTSFVRIQIAGHIEANGQGFCSVHVWPVE